MNQSADVAYKPQSIDEALEQLGFTKAKNHTHVDTRKVCYSERHNNVDCTIPPTGPVIGWTSTTATTSNGSNPAFTWINHPTYSGSFAESELKSLKKAYDDLKSENEKLTWKNKNQSLNYDGLLASHERLEEAHLALGKVLTGIPDVEATADIIAGYQKAVKDLQSIIVDKNNQMIYLEDALDNTLYEFENAVEAQEAAARDVISQTPSLADLQAEWDTLSLTDKVFKLSGGVTVWVMSSGDGPFRTLLESKTQIGKGEDTYGVWCRNSKGKDTKYPVADLTPIPPPARVKPNKFSLLATTVAGAATMSYLSYHALGAKGALIAGVVQTALMLFQMREYSKS